MDAHTIRKVAKLARIDVEEARLDGLATGLSDILDWVEQLGEVDIDGVEAMSSAADMPLPMRADRVTMAETGGGKPGDIIANAPKSEDNFFVVPKVVE